MSGRDALQKRIDEVCEQAIRVGLEAVQSCKLAALDCDVLARPEIKIEELVRPDWYDSERRPKSWAPL
jgi:hypothetical protein